MNKLKVRLHSLLRWSEKYFKTDMVYLARGGFWLTFGQGVSTVAVFALNVVVANVINPAIYGTYKYITSIASTISAMSFTGSSIAIQQSIAKGFSSSLIRGVRQFGIGYIPALTVSICIGAYYLIKGDFIIGSAIFLSVLLMGISTAGLLYGSYLSGIKNFRLNTLIWSAGLLVSNIITIILILFGYRSVVSLVLSILGVSAIVNMITLLVVAKNIPCDHSHDIDLLSKNKHLSFINLLGTLSSNIDKIMLFQISGPTTLAQYNFAAAIVEQFRSLFKNISRLALPKFAERKISEIKESIFRKIMVYIFFAALFSTVYYFAAPYIFTYVFPQYLSSIHLSQILGIFVFASASLIPVTVFQAHHLIKEMYVFNISSSIFELITDIFLIATLGVWGAVIADALQKLFTFILSLYLMRGVASKV